MKRLGQTRLVQSTATPKVTSLGSLGLTTCLLSLGLSFASAAQAQVTPDTTGAIISEFRRRGVDSPAPGNNPTDEYVEIYNTTEKNLNVSGWKLFYRYGSTATTATVTIPANTILPPRGHYLFVGKTYSLSGYSQGPVSGGDQALDPIYQLPDTGEITLRNAANVPRDTTNLPSPVQGAAPSNTVQYAFVRRSTATNNFDLVSVTGTAPGGAAAGTTPTLGAPGPQSRTSPSVNRGVLVDLFDKGAAFDKAPNRTRFQEESFPPGTLNPTYQQFGTIELRRTIVNNTGAPITHLRVRAVVLTTLNSRAGEGGATSPQADLRLLTSQTKVLNRFNGGPETVFGTTLEPPSTIPPGGGLNSNVVQGTVALSEPIPATAGANSRSYNFLFGVQREGSFVISLDVEVLPPATPAAS